MHPDWEMFNINKNVALGILQNGNISPILKIGSNNVIVKNTCGFDSIVQIVAAVCVYEKFKENVDIATIELLNL